jgi:NADPH-dependent glutamate synthase beta subunit-like oxidoreductase
LDSSGRRRPVPKEGSQHELPLDTLIVAISESSDLTGAWEKGEFRLDTEKEERISTDEKTLLTNRPGVFAGGDAATGPHTVVDAIAAGKKAAIVIERYLRGEELVQPAAPRIPKIYIEPEKVDESKEQDASRAEQPVISLKSRKSGFDEVELSLDEENAIREAGRCLRCDLEFTQPKQNQNEQALKKAN